MIGFRVHLINDINIAKSYVGYGDNPAEAVLDAVLNCRSINQDMTYNVFFVETV